MSSFYQVFRFIVEGCLYFVLIIGCHWKDESHWFCGWLGALLAQTIDCPQGLCWAGIDAGESSPLVFIYFCLHWLKHAIVQGLLSHADAKFPCLFIEIAPSLPWQYLTPASAPIFPFLSNELRVLLWPVNINHGERGETVTNCSSEGRLKWNERI